MNPIEEKSCPRLAPGVRLQKDALNGEPVLVFPEGVVFINASAHEILLRCDGKAAVREIIAALDEEYEGPGGSLREDVVECLTDLNRRRLVVF